jgi:hypothetical protein
MIPLVVEVVMKKETRKKKQEKRKEKETINVSLDKEKMVIGAKEREYR